MFRVIRIKHGLLALAAAVLVVAGAVFGAGWAAAAQKQAGPAETGGGVTLPVIMYHSLLKDEAYQGKYVLSPDQLERDLVYLREHGYTTVQMRDVLSYVEDGVPLPEKPVILSFDDGFYNNYLYAYPLMQQYGEKMVIAPVGAYSDEYSKIEENHANYSYLKWDQIAEMAASGLVEFQNHSYQLHDNRNGRSGAARKRGESYEEYRALLREDLGRMQEKLAACTGVTPTTMVFPFGAISDDSIEIVREMGFQAVFTCREKLNTITRDPECLFSLGRFLRPSGPDSAAFFEDVLPD